jgi:ankyrin repeat protein
VVGIRAYSKPVKGYECTGGWQPLQFAVMQGFSLRAIDTLLQHGASIADTTTAGCTAAWLAARYLGCFMLEHCFHLGAKVFDYSPTCGSLLHAAASSGNVDVMILLLDRGLLVTNADYMYYTSRQLTPLHCAAQAGHVAMVQLLIDEGCDVTDTDSDGNTALRLCLHGAPDNAACFQLLLEAGCDILDTAGATRYDCIRPLILLSMYIAYWYTSTYIRRIVVACFSCLS